MSPLDVLWALAQAPWWLGYLLIHCGLFCLGLAVGRWLL